MATPVPTATGRPYAGQTVTYAMPLHSPVATLIPAGTTLSKTPTGGVRAESTRAGEGSLYVEWVLPESVFPAGARVANVHTLVCGSASGDFYEVYGPYGADEIEYEASPPSPDGCWHFTKDPGSDYRVEIYVNGDSTMTIERIEFRVTFGD
jgi:hypothetical protein